MDIREKFEKLPEIKLRLIGMVFCFSKSQYIPKNKIIKEVVVAAKEVNLAWYAFQEQQKKIDAIVSIVREADLSDGDSSVAIVHDEIQELLK